jgi:hypothetical protein
MKDEIEQFIQKKYCGWNLRRGFLIPEVCKPFTVIIERENKVKSIVIDPQKIVRR